MVGMAVLWIGAAAMMGILLGMTLTQVPERLFGSISGLASGIMLCAAVHELVIPGMEQSSAFTVCLGVCLGAMLLGQLNGWLSRRMPQGEEEANRRAVSGCMFVIAMAAHHLPEGLAAGVSFGLGRQSATASVCAAIALQNVPETIMIFPAVAQMGGSGRKQLGAAVVSVLVEIAGLFLGYAAVQVTVAMLPMLLAVAAGAMLYVIVGNMLAELNNGGLWGTYGFILGYCAMLWLTEALAVIL